MKDNFLLKRNQKEVFDELTDEEAGRLIKGIFNYVSSGNSGLDGYLKIIFIPIKTEIDKNEESYKKRCETNKENGKLGGRPTGKSILKTTYGLEIPQEVEEHQQFLYFIYDNVQNQYKIGETHNLIKRRYDIKRPTNNLEILDFYIGNVGECQRLEKEVLQEYKQYSVGGDWFELPDNLVDEILQKYFQKNQSVITKAKGYEENMNNHISYITNHISNINNHNSNNNLDIIKDIINYLNLKTNSKYKYTTKSTQQKINARLNEGYMLDDFIAVIDKKYNEWIGTEFERYMNPETLFGTKFEKYLNQKTTRSKKTLKDISMSDLDRAIEIEKQRSGIN